MKAQIRLRTVGGIKWVEVSALMKGLALFSDNSVRIVRSGAEVPMWNVTHVRTGMCVAHFPTETIGREALNQLLAVMNWDVPPKKLRAALRNHAPALSLIVREHDGYRLGDENQRRTFSDLPEDA